MVNELKTNNHFPKINDKILNLSKLILSNLNTLILRVNDEISIIQFKNTINLNSIADINYL